MESTEVWSERQDVVVKGSALPDCWRTVHLKRSRLYGDAAAETGPMR